MTRKMFAASFALFAIFTAYAGPQDAQAPEEPGLAFPTEIEQVTVDVVVTDDDGNPITDLSAAEFEIEEDGKRQTITSFELFQVHVPADREPVETAVVEATAPPSTPVQTSTISSNTDEKEQQGRTFVVVYDDVHLTVFTAQQAKAAVANFLKNETYEGDRVTLLAPGSGSWWTATMPGGLDDLLGMLEKQEALLFPDMEKDRLSDYEAMRIHNFRDNMILDRVNRRYATRQVQSVLGQGSAHQRSAFVEQDPYITSKAAETYYAATARNHVTLGAIKRALTSLVRIQGRKSMVLVSEGFVHDVHLREFKDILTAAREANTAVYFLDTTGLKAVATIMDAEFSQLPSIEDQGFVFAQEYERSEGSVSIAQDTGGFTVRNDNDLALGLKRIADETRAYYLIGYNPTNLSRDGKFRKIKVNVPHRKGTKVRARKGYYGPSDEDVEEAPAGSDPAFQIAVDSPYDVPDIPLRMTHFIREETFLDKAKVYIAAEVDIDGLEFHAEEGLDVASMNFLMVTVHRESGEYFRIDQKMDLKLPPEEHAEMSRTWLPIVRDFDLGPGHYRAKFILRDKATDRLGTVIHNFEIPELTTFRVSTPVLSDMREKDEEGMPGDRLALMARREFVPDSELFCQFHVYGATKLASSGMPRVTMAYEVRRSGDGAILTHEARSLILPTDVGGLSRMIGFPLEWAPPGDYELVMSVKDEISGKRVEMSEPFSVVEAPAAAADHAPPAPSPPAQTAETPAESTGR